MFRCLIKTLKCYQTKQFPSITIDLPHRANGSLKFLVLQVFFYFYTKRRWPWKSNSRKMVDWKIPWSSALGQRSSLATNQLWLENSTEICHSNVKYKSRVGLQGTQDEKGALQIMKGALLMEIWRSLKRNTFLKCNLKT